MAVKNYRSPDGFHTHKCTHCSTVWEHSNAMKGDEDAHRCPKCNAEQWTRYQGYCHPCYPANYACTPVSTSSSTHDLFSLLEILLRN